MTELNGIIETALAKTIDEMVKNVIAQKSGYGIDSDVKKTIKERAEYLLANSPELNELLLNAMRSWITAQTADDFRKAQEEVRKRYGR